VKTSNLTYFIDTLRISEADNGEHVYEEGKVVRVLN
jgi:hypothetical protein